MDILMLTNEYPPHIYGGAGVHVAQLCRELVQVEGWREQLRINCFGDQCTGGNGTAVEGIPGPDQLFQDLRYPKLLDALYRNLVMIGRAEKADLIHCHTWYTYLTGCILKQILGAPLVITVHSLEPHRPWKKEQMGNAYYATSWLEKTALSNADGIIAVSAAMQQDVIELYGVDALRVRVIHNGIDTQRFHKVQRPDIVARYGIDPARPYVLFVGRITRQKGILHLVHALPMLDKGVQVVLCAGAPDTEAIGAEMQRRVKSARKSTENDIIWVNQMVPEDDLVALYSHAELFVCPSVYEPFGIINLEAMACGIPVVASAVGGIPEVVVHEKTGLLVPFEQVKGGDPEPREPQQYARDLAEAINALLRAPQKRERMGRAARERVETYFSWQRIAERTLHYYRELTCRPPAESAF